MDFSWFADLRRCRNDAGYDNARSELCLDGFEYFDAVQQGQHGCTGPQNLSKLLDDQIDIPELDCEQKEIGVADGCDVDGGIDRFDVSVAEAADDLESLRL